MTEQHEKISENKTAVTAAYMGGGTHAVQLKDNREYSVVQQKLSEKATNQESGFAPVQRKNNTGLPDTLKSGIENLSGHTMDDVKVHYNSDKPAQLNAHAYAQGTDIHVASGQEKHLAHEAWHVVQQKQGRVKPTLQMKGKVNVNDDKGLEKEADVMGAKALQLKQTMSSEKKINLSGFQTTTKLNEIIQRQEISTIVTGITHLVLAKGNSIYKGSSIREVKHGDKVEIETSQKLRSRRGPNQEIFARLDHTNDHMYRWFKVIAVNEEKVGENIYIRDDTFNSKYPVNSKRESQISEFKRTRQSLSGVTPLRAKYPKENFPKLYENGLIDKYEAIQRLLKNKGAVHMALLHLETCSKKYLINKKAERPTQALNIALFDMENQWMGKAFFDLREQKKPEKKEKLKKPEKPNSDRKTIVQENDALGFQKQFLTGVVQKVVPFKDVGAPLPHGEYAHRIQWYIIAYYYLGAWGGELLTELHKEAGNMQYLQKLENPRIAIDAYRSLWDYVVDIRRNESTDVVQNAEATYAASPVMITSDLLGYNSEIIKSEEGNITKFNAGKLVKTFPVIAHAVANRRRKRALENALKKTPEAVKPDELDPLTGWVKREEWLKTKMSEFN